MVRARLTLLILVLLATVLFVSGALVWTVSQAQYHLDRSQFANDQLGAYRAVSEATYRHFKQLGDLAVSGDAANQADLADSARSLRESLDRLKRLTEREVVFVDDRTRPGEVSEISRVDALAETINAILREHEQLRSRLGHGDDARARAALIALTEKQIDGTFAAQIQAAIKDEASEVREAHDETTVLFGRLVLVAGAVGVFGLLLSAVAVHFLSTRIARPMKLLMTGVQELTQGRLDHRTGLKGADEFSRLGAAMDDMACRLDAQRGQLVEARAGLERMVTARTEELARANERLRSIDSTRQEFLENISHELRTPITVIRGEADVTLRDRHISVATCSDALNRVREQASWLGKLVDELLLIARSKTDVLRLEMKPVDLNGLVKEACRDAAVLAGADVEIDLTTAGGKPAAMGDHDRLLQLFMILLDNAIRYSSDAHRVRASVRATARHSIISIANDGPGMTADEAQNAFERFYRGETGRSRAPHGLGLGLHIAKAIVDAHHGEVHIESAPDAGALVTVKFPRAAALKAIA